MLLPPAMPDANPRSVATILGRWQPPHLGHQAALQALCGRFERVIIGIGSANVHDYRNPFSLAEVTQMLHLALPGCSNYTLVPIPDVIDDGEWCQIVREKFGEPDHFVTANPYVESLLRREYRISHPLAFIPEGRKIRASGTQVRREMARGDGWQPLVPAQVREFILAHGLDRRFRQTFGLHTLALETIIL